MKKAWRGWGIKIQSAHIDGWPVLVSRRYQCESFFQSQKWFLKIIVRQRCKRYGGYKYHQHPYLIFPFKQPNLFTKSR